MPEHAAGHIRQHASAYLRNSAARNLCGISVRVGGEVGVRSNRLWIIATLAAGVTSTSLLLWASLDRRPLPAWGGPIDVVIAFVVIALAGVLWTNGHDWVDAPA